MGRTASVRSVPDIDRLRRSLRAWYRRAARDLPWRRTREPYPVWVSEVMLQQTTVAAVIPYYTRFLARYPDIRSLAASDEDELLAHWSGLGYYRRARNLRQAAKIVMQRHRGRFPSTLDQIRALPGLGPYSAGAIASICFGVRAPAVDGNVARVLSRIFAIRPAASGAGERGRASRRESVQSAIWRIAEELIPADRPGDWTQAVMELGARICKPASPDCPSCPVALDCRALSEGRPTLYPARRSRPLPLKVHASLVAILRRGRVLLVRRDGEELLGGLWELPGTLSTALAGSAQREKLHAIPRADGRPFAVSETVETGRPPRASRGRSGSARAAGRSSEGPAAKTERATAIGSAPSRSQIEADATAVLDAIRSGLGFEPESLERAGAVRHAITHRRVTIEAWRGRAPVLLPAGLKGPRGSRHRWADPRAFGTIPIGAASRKVLDVLGMPSSG